jgi:UDP-N-acetylmuramoyl-tripeptide--D-alanyl-D-alanine ligase
VATPIPRNRASLDAFAAAAAMSGRTVRATGKHAVGVFSDSRAVVPGSAFVALRGERFDGHDHQKAAIEAGAVLVVAERGRASDDARADAVEVEDTLFGWGRVARAHLRAWRRARAGTDAGRVITITGSAGKTTTKEICAALLSAVGPTWSTPGNLNNLVGLPAAALCVEHTHRFVVLEAGMSVPNEIERLAAIAEPDVAVVTNVSVAHAEGVGGTRGDVAREKGALFAALGPSGFAVAPADDDAAMAQLARTSALHTETFGRAKAARYRLADRVSRGLEGSRLVVERPCGEACPTPRARETIEITLPLVGEAAAIDFLAALAAAEAALGAPMGEGDIARALAGLVPTAGRASLRTLADGTLIIDDSYNANPASVRAALSTLGELAKGKRAVAVLGEMRELGAVSQDEHAAIGDAVVDARVAVLVSCGGLMDLAAARAEARGVEVHRAPDAKAAAEIAVRAVRAGDVVLVKGSRGVATEVVVTALTSDALFARGGKG